MKNKDEKNKLLNKFNETRKKSIEICKNLEIEDYSVQPHQDISPPKWHLAHTSWFFEQIIILKINKNKNPIIKNIILFSIHIINVKGNTWPKQNEEECSQDPPLKKY